MSHSSLYAGQVMHRRLRPRMHRLSYRIFSLLLDLDEIDLLDGKLRLFSRNRFNLIAFHDRDHGDGSAVPLRVQVERHLRRAGICEPLERVTLLAMPRIFGFVFNPLSLYFCHGCGGRLRAILYEVHNTFAERHLYVLPVDGTGTDIRQACGKAFHVSPFLPMELDYAFRIRPPGDRLRIAISASNRDGIVIAAVQTARRRALTDRALAQALATYGWMTLKVVLAIGWEALKLRLKGLRVYPHHPAVCGATYGDSANRPQREAA